MQLLGGLVIYILLPFRSILSIMFILLYTTQIVLREPNTLWVVVRSAQSGLRQPDILQRYQRQRASRADVFLVCSRFSWLQEGLRLMHVAYLGMERLKVDSGSRIVQSFICT